MACCVISTSNTGHRAVCHQLQSSSPQTLPTATIATYRPPSFSTFYANAYKLRKKNNLPISMKNVDVDTSIICMLSPLTTNQPTADTPVTYERPDTRPDSICRPRLLSTTCLQSCDTSRWPRRQACCGHCVETSVTCEL